jgi:hypothetical protein
MLEEIQDRFFNISRIFDCISCDKCRLNGKVQISGLGTALKILFTNERDLKKLKKTELIGLIHLVHKLSESIKFYQDFLKMEEDMEFQAKVNRYIATYLLVASVAILGYMCEKALKPITSEPEAEKVITNREPDVRSSENG